MTSKSEDGRWLVGLGLGLLAVVQGLRGSRSEQGDLFRGFDFPTYSVFVVIDDGKKIESGWDTPAMAKKHIQDDLGDSPVWGNPVILSRREVLARGMDPKDGRYWI